MPVPEPFLTIAAAITEAVFGYLLDSTGINEKIRVWLRGDPIRDSYQNALGRAIIDFYTNHSEYYNSLFDLSFFKNEAAPILAQFLVPNGRPDSLELARRWASSLGLSNPLRINELVWQCEPAAAYFLESLGNNLQQERLLQDINNERRFENISVQIGQLVTHFNALKATPATYRRYLRWIIDRNSYLDPRGTFQVQRQIQLCLDEIYISLSAQLETSPSRADRASLQRELEKFENKRVDSKLQSEEVEDKREAIIALYGSHEEQSNIALSLHDVVRENERIIILGDPGSGKTTLLRYLALRNAQAIYCGLPIGVLHEVADLGTIRFPIFVRISDYSENEIWKQKPLSEFIVSSCIINECPREGLNDMFESMLMLGGCLVLLDGLDEVVETDDRRGIVQRIEDFVRRYIEGGQRGKNKFVITSRIAGYRSASLGEPFSHYVIRDMENYQIRRFLERWCIAVEDAQTPELTEAARQATAKREVDSIMSAVNTTVGVQRLATNPLMLRTLALINRTGSRLPQHRIELYELAANTLSHTWRTAQGVPLSALIEERYLTRLLAKMGYWLHANKPTGLATEREVFDVLGEEWAKINKLNWEGEESSPEIEREVKKFLLAVREHTGLFVERAPKRFGFMHLTFEEYYAARYLVSKIRDAARIIKQHLHDPRWDEPILLALGFIGLDYPEEAADLLETILWVKGNDAEELKFRPSDYENLLGRDFLFGIRCLGDQIPANPEYAQYLVQRLWNELTLVADQETESLPLCFQVYQSALWQHIQYLEGNEILEKIIVSNILGLIEDETSDEPNNLVFSILDNMKASLDRIISKVTQIINGYDTKMKKKTIKALGKLRDDLPISGDILLRIINNASEKQEIIDLALDNYLWTSKSNERNPVSVDITDLDDIYDDSSDQYKYMSEDDSYFEDQDIDEGLDEDSDEEEIQTSFIFKHFTVSTAIPNSILQGFLMSIGEEDYVQRKMEVVAMIERGVADESFIRLLIREFKCQDLEIQRIISGLIMYFENASPFILEFLNSLLNNKDSTIRQFSAVGLARKGIFNDVVEKRLIEAIKVRYIQREAANLLGFLGSNKLTVIQCLLDNLHDVDDNKMSTSIDALVLLAKRYPENVKYICDYLAKKIMDSENIDMPFSVILNRDYEYETLWAILS